MTSVLVKKKLKTVLSSSCNLKKKQEALEKTMVNGFRHSHLLTSYEKNGNEDLKKFIILVEKKLFPAFRDAFPGLTPEVFSIIILRSLSRLLFFFHNSQRNSTNGFDFEINSSKTQSLFGLILHSCFEEFGFQITELPDIKCLVGDESASKTVSDSIRKRGQKDWEIFDAYYASGVRSALPLEEEKAFFAKLYKNSSIFISLGPTVFSFLTSSELIFEEKRGSGQKKYIANWLSSSFTSLVLQAAEDWIRYPMLVKPLDWVLNESEGELVNGGYLSSTYKPLYTSSLLRATVGIIPIPKKKDSFLCFDVQPSLKYKPNSRLLNLVNLLQKQTVYVCVKMMGELERLRQSPPDISLSTDVFFLASTEKLDIDKIFHLLENTKLTDEEKYMLLSLHNTYYNIAFNLLHMYQNKKIYFRYDLYGREIDLPFNPRNLLYRSFLVTTEQKLTRTGEVYYKKFINKLLLKGENKTKSVDLKSSVSNCLKNRNWISKKEPFKFLSLALDWLHYGSKGSSKMLIALDSSLLIFQIMSSLIKDREGLMNSNVYLSEGQMVPRNFYLEFASLCCSKFLSKKNYGFLKGTNLSTDLEFWIPVVETLFLYTEKKFLVKAVEKAFEKKNLPITSSEKKRFVDFLIRQYEDNYTGYKHLKDLFSKVGELYATSAVPLDLGAFMFFGSIKQVAYKASSYTMNYVGSRNDEVRQSLRVKTELFLPQYDVKRASLETFYHIVKILERNIELLTLEKFFQKRKNMDCELPVFVFFSKFYCHPNDAALLVDCFGLAFKEVMHQQSLDKILDDYVFSRGDMLLRNSQSRKVSKVIVSLNGELHKKDKGVFKILSKEDFDDTVISLKNGLTQIKKGAKEPELSDKVSPFMLF